VGELATVDVQLTPSDAAKDATAFGIVSWQGGGRVSASLDEVAPGQYRSSEPVPVNGRWKSMVGLQRGDEVMAAPIYLPADPEIGAPEIPALPERQEPFVRNTKLLLREQHDGDDYVALLAYAGLALVVGIWVLLFAVTAYKAPLLDDEEERADRPMGPVARPSTPLPAAVGADPASPESWYGKGKDHQPV
jgi:hypothetical protein